MKTVYICGPIQGADTESNKERFERAENYLAELGYNFINPNKQPDMGSLRDNLCHRMRLIENCDCLFLLYHSSSSNVANCELYFAKGFGTPILRADKTDRNILLEKNATKINANIA